MGWLIDIVPGKRFRQLAVQGLPDLGNFEVPSGGFSFDDRLFLFIAREKYPATGPAGKMRASHLAVSVGIDPSQNFKHVFNVSLMIGDLPASEVPSHLNSADFKGGQWLVHVVPPVPVAQRRLGGQTCLPTLVTGCALRHRKLPCLEYVCGLGAAHAWSASTTSGNVAVPCRRQQHRQVMDDTRRREDQQPEAASAVPGASRPWRAVGVLVSRLATLDHDRRKRPDSIRAPAARPLDAS